MKAICEWSDFFLLILSQFFFTRIRDTIRVACIVVYMFSFKLSEEKKNSHTHIVIRFIICTIHSKSSCTTANDLAEIYLFLCLFVRFILKSEEKTITPPKENSHNLAHNFRVWQWDNATGEREKQNRTEEEEEEEEKK